MKVWKIDNVFGNGWDLVAELNKLEQSGVIIKEILYIEKYYYQIVYTVEDIIGD